jgi:hypothetical protein
MLESAVEDKYLVLTSESVLLMSYEAWTSNRTVRLFGLSCVSCYHKLMLRDQ